jgi:hypothetical protein
LEVDLADILKPAAVAEIPVETAGPAGIKKPQFIYLLPLIGLVLVGLLYLLPQFYSPAVPVLQAKRLLPAYAAPGSRILIQIDLSAERSLKGMILKETFPPGWRLLESEPRASHVDADAGVARWIFRQPLQQTRVFYLLKVPEETDSGANLNFDGELIANPEGQRSVATLQSIGTMQVMPFHWADSNGDQVIDDIEILELSDLTDAAKTLDLDWDLIETIWQAEAYRWDAENNEFIPLRPGSEPIE